MRLMPEWSRAEEGRTVAFMVRSRLGEFEAGGERPRLGAFTDEDWGRLLALAAEHGFDRAGEYSDLLFPAEGESRELPLAAAQALAVALSELLREETSPEGETGGDAWVYVPEQGWSREPVIRVGPQDRPDRQVGWTQARQLGKLAESGPLIISRVEEPRE